MKKGNSDMNFIQEVLYISIYRNTISKNPTKKIPLAKNHTIFICFCYAIVAFLLLVCYFLFSNIFLYIAAVFLFIMFFTWFYYRSCFESLKKYLLNTDSETTVHEDGISTLLKGEICIKIDCPWDTIQCIIIEHYSVCVLLKKKVYPLIMFDIENYSRIKKSLEKYDKMDLVIDNSELYE